MISFACTSCGKHLKVKDELAGKKGKCPGCGQTITIPATSGRPATPSRPGAAPGMPPPSPPRPEETLATNNSLSGASETGAYLPGESTEDLSLDVKAFLAPAQAPDELGRLGSYRVLKVLGQGGMGLVFHAEDPHLKRAVALKVVRPTVALSAAVRQRFIREAQATAAVKNDHVVAIYQVGEERGLPFLAMEFLEGQPLDAYLQQRGRLPLTEVLHIGRQMAEGLAAAHARGLIHRDVKPANTWLETLSSGRGPRYRVKLLDFGLARAVGDTVNLTQSGAIVGTPAYMAPEQASGEKVDHRCDLFSLGCVLYELCTGERAFKGENAMQVLHSLSLTEPRPVQQLNPEVPAALAELTHQLLAKSPGGRPSSAQEVAERLEDLASQAGSQPMVQTITKQHQAPPAIRVSPTQVIAQLDGNEVFQWQGRPEQLSLPKFWEIPRPGRLFLGTVSEFAVHRMSLRRLGEVTR